ncbi:UPF0103-domain-containing protein [Trichodelitschia bisporula]|uniref:UPF0103-domain-containing protein n=1 Tax=Trichodelitschia bisporula TaxID=703511 RepID=A0A6G1I3J2_9PEZI|nr:UPF0103-domain-containing protein [Trichodelitschia bisporula]
MTTRQATHAGSWYTGDGPTLSRELDEWLAAVPAQTTPIGASSAAAGPVSLPASGARAIIAPHAGYSYSGPAAAWAYKAIDWSVAGGTRLTGSERVFLLGPSHHYYLTGAALSRCAEYETPMGNLRLDAETIAELKGTGVFETMSVAKDDAEHSLEMHLPYIFKMLSQHHSSPADFPPLTPILIGSTSPVTERRLGGLLAQYLANPRNVFVVSSDFCHWGSRFQYTYYQPGEAKTGYALSSKHDPRQRGDPAIHESIAKVDAESMDAIETGSHAEFLDQLARTGNTVCGRHPIGVIMAAIEAGGLQGEGNVGKFKFVRYERSSLVHHIRDSSVSYCSAFAVLPA